MQNLYNSTFFPNKILKIRFISIAPFQVLQFQQKINSLGGRTCKVVRFHSIIHGIAVHGICKETEMDCEGVTLYIVRRLTYTILGAQFLPSIYSILHTYIHSLLKVVQNTLNWWGGQKETDPHRHLCLVLPPPLRPNEIGKIFVQNTLETTPHKACESKSGQIIHT